MAGRTESIWKISVSVYVLCKYGDRESRRDKIPLGSVERGPEINVASMRNPICLPLSFLFCTVGVQLLQGQVTITAKDMFNEPGLFYRAHANSSPISTLNASGNPIMGSAGDNQLWDFQEGPTDEIYVFDYFDIDVAPDRDLFPNATFAERLTMQASGTQKWLYLEQAAGVGRRVHGLLDPDLDSVLGSSQLAKPFLTPIVDFPERIRMNDVWSTSTSVDLIDPVTFGLALRLQFVSSFKVDANGFIRVPNLGFGDALRVNELVTLNTLVATVNEDGSVGNFSVFQTDLYRTYHWLRPDLGIVAQMTSESGASAPPDDFLVATSFVRMFETNKKPGDPPPVCEEPEAVTELRIDPLGNGRMILNWNETECTESYRVEFSSTPHDPDSWLPLGEPTTKTFMVDANAGNSRARYYRVVSLE